MAFDHIIVYEDRDEIRTTRWSISGVVTKDSGNTDGGWLWYSTVKTGDNVVVTVYKDSAGSNSVMLASATDISGLDNDAENSVLITLAEANSSGLTGTMYIHDWTEDVTLVPMIVSLCMDSDIELIYDRSDEAHMTGVYDSTTGFADHCSMATGFILRWVAKKYPDQIGGFGGEADHKLKLAERVLPQWSRINAPEQLKDAATFYACWWAFMAQDESDGDDSMLATKAEACKEEHEKALASINLTFNTDPDADSDPDTRASAADVMSTRL